MGSVQIDRLHENVGGNEKCKDVLTAIMALSRLTIALATSKGRCVDELSGYDNDVDTLNVVLDGQKVSLDTKYGRVKNRRMYQFF